jgi:hypothetical protein
LNRNAFTVTFVLNVQGGACFVGCDAVRNETFVVLLDVLLEDVEECEEEVEGDCGCC